MRKERMGRKNVHPGVWGPPAWAFLKSAAEACDADSAQAYRDFFQLLPQVLPCERCREHCSVYLRENPIDVDDLPGWVARFEASVAEAKRAEKQGSCRTQAWARRRQRRLLGRRPRLGPGRRVDRRSDPLDRRIKAPAYLSRYQ